MLIKDWASARLTTDNTTAVVRKKKIFEILSHAHLTGQSFFISLPWALSFKDEIIVWKIFLQSFDYYLELGEVSFRSPPSRQLIRTIRTWWPG